MSVDFSRLVLAPCENLYSIPITIDPVISQPGAVPYAARGIFSTTPTDAELDDGAVVRTQTSTLCIRIEEFAIIPERNDKCSLQLPDETEVRYYWLADRKLDGEGGAATYELRQEV